MKLDTEFIRLPLRFDVARLSEEISAFEESEWRAHPTGFKGNSALILISKNGEQNDHFSGPMRPTPALGRCPYIKQVLASFQTVFGRSRLMRLAPFSEVPQHADINYHWKTRVRIHVPVVTDPDIRFICNGKAVHMAAGEVWIFDSWKQHAVVNPTETTRVHLVVDTAGTPEFWRMVAGSERPFGNAPAELLETQQVPYDPQKSPVLATEQFTHSMIMSPGELDGLITELLSELGDGDNAAIEAFTRLVNEFRLYWRSVWLMHGPTGQGWGQFQAIIEGIRARLDDFPGLVMRGNGTSATSILNSWVLSAALDADQFRNYNAGIDAGT